MGKYSVPIIVTTTYIYEVEARNGYEAGFKAGALEAQGEPATHEHETGRTMGKILPTVEGAKLDKTAGGAEHQEPSAKDPRKA